MQKLMEKGNLIFWLLEPKKEDEFLRQRFQKLRYEQYVIKNNRYWEPENEKHLEIDKYDSYSDYLVCVQSDKIIAGCRFVPNKMPIAKVVAREKIYPNSFEISRLTSNTLNISKCLFYPLIYEYALGKRFEYIYVLARRGFKKVFQKDKINIFKIIGQDVRDKNLILIPLMAKTSDVLKLAPQILNFI